jgi:hypothetical protein
MPSLGVAGIGLGLGSLFLQKEGADEQSEAIEKAAESTEEWQKYLVALEEKKYDEAARFRDLAYEQANLTYQQAQQLTPMYTKETMATYPQTMEMLRQDVLREPGTSELFKRGVGNISAGLAPFGISPNSSAFNRMYTDLLGQDIENVRQSRFKLAGYGTQPSTANVSATTGYPDMSAASQAQGNYASLIGAQGAVQGGLYGSLGQTATQMPLYYSLLQNMNSNTGQQGGGYGTYGADYGRYTGTGTGGSFLPLTGNILNY